MHKKLSERIQIPKDVSMDYPYLSLMGNQEIYIENFHGILEYHDNSIKLNTKLGRLHIKGKQLAIHYYSKDEIKINGVICGIQYLDGGTVC